MKRVLWILAVLVVAMACVAKGAAQPKGKVLLADARVGAVCSGPATMTGCVIALHDSTANTNLTPGSAVVVIGRRTSGADSTVSVPGVAVNRGDTLWVTRPCTGNETVVIGGRFTGTKPYSGLSAAVGARGQGACTAQAGQPSPVIVVQITG